MNEVLDLSKSRKSVRVFEEKEIESGVKEGIKALRD